MTAPGKPPVQSVRVDEDHRPAWVPWLIGLLLLALLAIILFFVLVDDDDDDDDLAVTTPITEPVDPVDPVEPVEPVDPELEEPEVDVDDIVIDVGDVPAGTAMADDVDVFADQVSPPELIGERIVANEVLVQELVADEAFYVGPEAGNTILVRLEEFAGEDQPESPFSVEAGGAVSFTGTLQEIDEELVSELEFYDGTDGLELGDYYVQIEEISSID